MKVAVVGAGAMGSLFGGYLAGSGHDVTLIDVNDAHTSAIREHGLTIETPSGIQLGRPRAGRPHEFSDKQDFILVFTKGMRTEEALLSALHLMDDHTWVVTAQNGLGNAECIARHVPLNRVAIGTTSYAADLIAPGRISFKPGGTLRVWSADGHPHQAVKDFADALAATGLDSAADPNTDVAIWEKVAFNAAINSLTAVLRCPVGGLTVHPAGRALAETIVAEVAQIAKARGIALDLGRVHALLDLSFTQHRAHRTSMMSDVTAGRKTEIENINGAVVAEAERLGLEIPATKTLLLLVRLLDQNNQAQAGRPATSEEDPVPASASGQKRT